MKHTVPTTIAVTALVVAVGLGCGGGSPVTNTAINERDRDGAHVTPLDQSNTIADLEVASRIRKALVADESLSTNAKNIKIVTMNGDVTLRGPVTDDRERDAVVRTAKQAAGQRNVVDNLDIAQP